MATAPRWSASDIELKASDIQAIYAAAEEELLRRMAQYLSAGGYEREWALNKLNELRYMQADVEGIVAALERETMSLTGKYTRNAYLSGWQRFEDLLSQSRRTHLATPSARVQALIEIQNDLSKRLDALNGTILRTVDDTYRQIVGEVVSIQATGTITTQQAVQDALNRFADRGITGFTDDAGHRWQMDSYANMAVRTSMMRASLQGSMDDMAAHDEHLVIVSDHEDECPICQPWEGKILSTDGSTKARHSVTGEQYDVKVAGTVEQATAAGLFHPNCLHAMTPYVHGLTSLQTGKDKTGRTAAQDAAGYAARQKQRYMENRIRQWKRREAVALDENAENYAHSYVQRWESKLMQFCNDTGLPRQKRREGNVKQYKTFFATANAASK